MNRYRLLPVIILLTICLTAVVGCAGPQGPEGQLGPAGPAGPIGPVGPAGENATASQEFVGAEKCGECHEDIYNKYTLTGHANDLVKIDGSAPTHPYDEMTGGIPEPPEGYTWDDISYVVGGVGWKALFLDKNGYVITGPSAQYNFAVKRIDFEADAGWSAYDDGEENVVADCGQCHTTGYRPQGHQHNLEGIEGTWEFEGVQCENCHGPGSRHAQDPYGVHMVLDRDSQLCGECHYRGDKVTIQASDGFELHNQQFNDLYNTKHFALSCVTCHDPHASTIQADETVNPKEGINQVCESCHFAQEAVQNNPKHSTLKCLDCHMPFMVLSGQGDLAGFSADIRSHQFAINPDPEAPQFNEDGSQVMPYLTLQYACQHCHNGSDFSEKSLEELSAIADGYHDPIPPTPTPAPEPTATPEAGAGGSS